MQQQQPTHRQSIRRQNGPIHCIDRQWFFATNGPRLYGPYATQEEAEQALARHNGETG